MDFSTFCKPTLQRVGTFRPFQQQIYPIGFGMWEKTHWMTYTSQTAFWQKLSKYLPWQKRIVILDLHGNLLQGQLPIPPPYTIFFSVSNNNLIGNISPSICDVTKLQILDLFHNNLTVKLPQCPGNFSKQLSVLNLKMNRFHGTIPEILKIGNNLGSLNFNGNQFGSP